MRGVLQKFLRWALLGWVETVASGILYLARVRLLQLAAPGRIGHLASELDAFLKERALGRQPWYLGVLLCPEGTAANEALLDYWGRYIWIVRGRLMNRVMVRFRRFPYLQFDASRYMVAINETSPYMAVLRSWGDRPPLLSLTEEHRHIGREWLASMGVPEDAEFICIHCRERGYSPEDDDMHSYRNASIENYVEALAPLREKGIWCIRMGDASMRPITPGERLIDFAHYPAREDWMDVFLCGSCLFLLGSSSGLTFLANVFGRPAGLANHVPLSAVLAAGWNDVAIPMLLWSDREERMLTFAEAFASDVANFRFTELYEARGIRTLENSADEISSLAEEMLDRAKGRITYSEDDDRLQARFKALMRPGHYSYGGVARVGRAFLRKYESLLGDRTE